ncbi:hypothetical protein TNCV_3771731 [Trichonephila clavipes]|nr:hypothetical protein TNCV_3771731 [Trichonephila clavipes]
MEKRQPSMTVNFVRSENCNFEIANRGKDEEGSAAVGKPFLTWKRESTVRATKKRDVLLQERTERAIAIWIEEQVRRRIPAARVVAFDPRRSIFRHFYKSMGETVRTVSFYFRLEKRFSASEGWLTGFLQEMHFIMCKITGEYWTIDEGAAKIFPVELTRSIEDGDYSADQVVGGTVKRDFCWRKKLPEAVLPSHEDEKTAEWYVKA